MFKFVALALVLTVCSSQRIVSLNGLSGLSGIQGLSTGINGLSGIDGNTQYVLVPVSQAQQQASIVRQAAPRLLAAPQQLITAQQPRVAYAQPKVVAAPQQVLLQQAPRVLTARAEENYGPSEPYTFGFQSTDEQGNSISRSETADGSGTVKGSYSYVDNKGLQRIVEYIADAAGYRASVKTNEPGTANANPADVQINAEEPPANVQQEIAAYSAQRVQRVQ